MANPFDQFDAAKPAASGANPFDQFDAGASGPPMPAFLFEHGPRANVLNAFGQGVSEGWGAGALGLSDESEDFLRKAGIFNDLDEGHQSWLRTFNEALIRPAAVAFDAVQRGGTALLRGAQAGVEAIGERAEQGGVPGAAALARDIAALPEAFPRGTAELGMPTPPRAEPEPVHPEATAEAVKALTPPDLAQARSLGVIGEGEEGWLGTAEPTPQAEEARAAAVKQTRQAAEEQPGGIAEPAAAPVQPEPPAAPDIHAIARQIDPDTFREYDALLTRRDTYRRWLDDLADTRQELAEAQAPHADEISDLQNRLETATGRRAANYQKRLDALLPERDAFIQDFLTRDTPDMARVRNDLLQNDYRMRDLAEPVSAAYRQAREKMPPVEAAVPSIVPKLPEESAAAPPSLGTDQATPETVSPTIQTPRLPIDIHDDAYQQLVAAGRPAEEANAAAALVAAHYDARAARFDGALGSASDLYQAEAPAIEAATGGRAGASGSTVLKDGEATIRLMGRADASTFIHETGHTWLEELMRDAAHEAAPEDLTRDAAAVRGWLGVGEGEAIPTRAHEKFARGFERYLMEGRAPSRNLATIFDQFKQWLTQIYQTVARLRSPITDDIRGVYDRLLALPNREPVIAEDMTIPRNFADEHEELAERAAPEVAHGAAERVRAEADRKALEEAPEVHDELNGRQPEPRSAGAEAPGNAPAGGEPGGHGPAPEPVAAATGAPEPTGAQRAGGNEAAPQGTGVGAATAERNDPERPLPEPDSRFIDRAGNIRLDLLGTPEDINQVIRDAASENDEFFGQRRGVIPDAEALRLADALGMDVAQLNLRKIGQAFNAEEVIAARKLLVQSATAVRDAMAKAAIGTDQDLMAYAMAKDRHRMIQGQVAGVTAEAGRALRAFRDMEGMQEAKQIGQFLEDATGRTLFQLRREATKGAALDTPSKVSKFVADSEKTGFFDWLQSYFVNALISGLATHGTYAIGNTLLALFKATAETGAQAAVGLARQAITGEAPTVRFGEIPAQLYGMMKGQRDGWRAAWDAFRTDQTVALPGEKIAAGTSFRTGVIPNPEIGGAKIPIGTVLESPSRMVAAIHSLSRTVSYEGSVAGQAYRIAANEGRTGDDLARRINQLTTTPTDEMMAAAVGEANETALMQRAPYRGFTSAVQRLTNFGVPLGDAGPLPLGTLRPLKFVDPFVAISTNVIKSAIVQRTPVGLFSREIRADLSGANGTAAFDRAAGRMLAGTSFYLMAGGLAAEGLITGSEPDDFRKAMMLRMTGWQAHSVKIGDTYYAANRLGVLGMALGIAADLYDVAHKAASEDLSTATAAAVHAFSQNILDESFMRGPSDLIRALTEHERYGPAFVRNFLSSFVPFSVGAAQIARTIDPYTRQARTITDAMLRKIPFESERLFPYRDIWGEPMPNHESLVPGVTAIYESRVNNDPVNQRMVALGMGATQPPRKIRGVALTDGQYDDYSRIAGRLAKTRLDRIVTAPGFSQMPEIAQREVISKTISGARRAAQSLVMMRNPEIIQQAITAKTAGIRPH